MPSERRTCALCGAEYWWPGASWQHRLGACTPLAGAPPAADSIEAAIGPDLEADARAWVAALAAEERAAPIAPAKRGGNGARKPATAAQPARARGTGALEGGTGAVRARLRAPKGSGRDPVKRREYMRQYMKDRRAAKQT